MPASPCSHVTAKYIHLSAFSTSFKFFFSFLPTYFFQYICVAVVQLLSHVHFFWDPMDYTLPDSMRFPKQEYWSGFCHLLLQEIISTHGSNMSLLHWQMFSLPLSHQGSLISSVQFSCLVVTDSLQPHESQHARPPCPSPISRIYSNSSPLSQ